MKDKPIMQVLEAVLDLRQSLFEAIVPDKAQSHFRSSHKEALLGVKALLEHSIERLDRLEAEKEEKKAAQASRTVQITE